MSLALVWGGRRSGSRVKSCRGKPVGQVLEFTLVEWCVRWRVLVGDVLVVSVNELSGMESRWCCRRSRLGGDAAASCRRSRCRQAGRRSCACCRGCCCGWCPGVVSRRCSVRRRWCGWWRRGSRRRRPRRSPRLTRTPRRPVRCPGRLSRSRRSRGCRPPRPVSGWSRLLTRVVVLALPVVLVLPVVVARIRVRSTRPVVRRRIPPLRSGAVPVRGPRRMTRSR